MPVEIDWVALALASPTQRQTQGTDFDLKTCTLCTINMMQE